MRISGSAILVTGVTGGIGRALARQLAAEGATLTVTSRHAEALAPLAEDLGARSLLADLAEADQVTRLAEQCQDIDVLIANAALPASGDLLDYTPEQVDRALAVNLRAPIMLARLLAPRMVERGHGHLAFVGSLSGKAATPYSSLYTATKFGLRGFAEALRLDLRDSGIGVSVIQPGFVSGAGMFAATGVPTPSRVRTVTPAQVAAAIIRAIEQDRCEVNIAPLKLRLRCAIAAQFPSLADRNQRNGRADDLARQIVEAQRSYR